MTAMQEAGLSCSRSERTWMVLIQSYGVRTWRVGDADDTQRERSEQIVLKWDTASISIEVI